MRAVLCRSSVRTEDRRGFEVRIRSVFCCTEDRQKIAQNNQAIGLKMIEQAETNTHEAFAAMRKAAQATDLSSVMQIQGDFLREQGTRSMAQARELGELIAQFGRDAVSTLRGGGSGQG